MLCEASDRTISTLAAMSPRRPPISSATSAPSPAAVAYTNGMPIGETTMFQAVPKNSSTTVGTSAASAPIRFRARVKKRPAHRSTPATAAIRSGR